MNGTPPGWAPSGHPEGPLVKLMKAWHVGYGFYRDFCKEKECRDEKSEFRMGLPWGWAPLGHPEGPEGPPLNLMKARHVGYRFYTAFCKEKESRFEKWYGFQSGVYFKVAANECSLVW